MTDPHDDGLREAMEDAFRSYRGLTTPGEHFEKRMREWLALRDVPAEPAITDDPHKRCGRCDRPNICWYVATPLWDASGCDMEIVCVQCFVVALAEQSEEDGCWELRLDPQTWRDSPLVQASNLWRHERAARPAVEPTEPRSDIVNQKHSSAVDPATDTPLRVALDIALGEAGTKTYWNDKLDLLEAAVIALGSRVEPAEPELVPADALIDLVDALKRQYPSYLLKTSPEVIAAVERAQARIEAV